MREAIIDLKNALAEQMTGTPYDADSTLPETDRIRGLAEAAEDYLLGDTNLSELVATFADTGFDIQLWISLKEQEGVILGDDDGS